MRINKFFSAAGICSRRTADRLIEEGCILINGIKAAKGEDLSDKDIICIDRNKFNKAEYNIFDSDKLLMLYKGVKISELLLRETVILAFNKPRGIVCSCSDNDKAVNIINYINYKERIYPIGRLDKDSEGLILLTNDGELANEITKASNMHEKEYIVEVDKDIDDNFIKKMEAGIYINELNKKTAPCKLVYNNGRSFNIILNQGLNRQIRRMCKELGYNVVKLKRIRIMKFNLDDLKTGEYKKISRNEIYR